MLRRGDWHLLLAMASLAVVALGVWQSGQIAVKPARAAWETPTAPAADPTLLAPARAPAELAAPDIVGGEEAPPGAYPWVAALVQASQPNAFLGQFCGGALVRAQWVLTAAHCVFYSFGEPKPAAAIQVVIGRHRLTSSEGVRVGVTQIVTHPSYVSSTKDYDIALLELAAPVAFEPVTMVQPQETTLFAPGVLARVIGWGNTTPSSNRSDTLQQVDVPIVEQAICSTDYNDAITARMICAGFTAGGKDSCQGDSGGPLSVWDDMASNWKQVGIVSWGNGCALPDFPGVYTRLSELVSWVESVAPAVPPTPTPTTTSTPAQSPTPTMTGTLPTATPTATATNTPIGIAYLPLVHRALTPTATRTPGSDSVGNGDFEQGHTSWTESSRLGNPLIMNRVALPIAPYAGEWVAWLGGDDGEVSALRQRITIPAASPYLAFWIDINSADVCGYDWASVLIDDVVVDELGLCASTATFGWVRQVVNLSAYVGRAVELEFHVETDDSSVSNLFVDNVAFGSTALADSTQPGPLPVGGDGAPRAVSKRH